MLKLILDEIDILYSDLKKLMVEANLEERKKRKIVLQSLKACWEQNHDVMVVGIEPKVCGDPDIDTSLDAGLASVDYEEYLKGNIKSYYYCQIHTYS